MAMFFQLAFAIAVVVFVMLLAAANTLGFSVGIGYFFSAMVAAPLLTAAVLFSIIWVAEWSERYARTRRIAKAKARKLKESQ
jgi:hypothetical protein